MLFLLSLLHFKADCIDVSSIPSTGIPPMQRYAGSAVYDSLENRIITFGGCIDAQDAYLSDLYSFDLNSSIWSEILPDSLLIPDGIAQPYTYLRSNSTLLVFFGLKYSGLSSDVYSFDLISFSWKIEQLTGERILGRTGFGAAEYKNDQNETFVAMFGGLTHSGATNELIL